MGQGEVLKILTKNKGEWMTTKQIQKIYKKDYNDITTNSINVVLRKLIKQGFIDWKGNYTANLNYYKLMEY